MHVTLPEFLDCLFTTGRVRVPKPAAILERERLTADEVLAAFEREYRRELPGVPPPVCPPAAGWAATMLYRACQFVAFRDVDHETIAGALNTACPAGDPPAVHYSVDLAFRYLPDLTNLAQRLAAKTRCSCTWAAGRGGGRCRRWASGTPGRSRSAPGPTTRASWVSTPIAWSRVATYRASPIRASARRCGRPWGCFPSCAPEMAAAAGQTSRGDYLTENVP